jgi:negative regulator of replication initiation
MRTTLNLDDDVVGRLKAFAESRSMALGKAASDLMRRGLNAKVETQVVNGIHVVVLPPDSPKVSPERVRHLLEDEL